MADAVTNPDLSTSTVSALNDTHVVSSKPDSSKSATWFLDSIDKSFMVHMSYALLVVGLVIIIIFIIKMWRLKRRDRVRRYDILSPKQLHPDLVIESESEDDLYDSSKLVK